MQQTDDFYLGPASIGEGYTRQEVAEMVLNYSTVTPAISPVPPNDRRAREPPGSPLGGSHLKPTIWPRGEATP